MGVDTKVTFKPGTQIQDLAKVAGALLGLPSELYAFPGSGGKMLRAHRVVGISFTAGVASMPTLVEIKFQGSMPLVGYDTFSMLYHFEWDAVRSPGSSGWMPRSRPITIALAIKLVEAFGGQIDFNDCDDSDMDFTSPGFLVPSGDGEPWRLYQEAMASIAPLTKADVEAAREFASYKD